MENYNVIPKSDETQFLLDCLSTYFDPLKGRQYKSPQNFKRYEEWKNTIHNPSAKTTYNFIRKYTTLVTNHDVIFTLTPKDGVFYRISRDYEKDVRKFRNKKNNTPKNNEKSNDGKKTQDISSNTVNLTATELPTHQNASINSDEDSLATPTPDSTNPTESNSDELVQIVQDMDKNLATEIVEITNVPDSKPTSMDQVIKEKMISLVPDITNLILAKLNDSTQRHTETCIETINDEVAKIQRTSFNVTLEQESYRQATEKIKNRIFFINKQLEDAAKAIDKHIADTQAKMEQMIDVRCTKAIESMEEKLTETEKDIDATLISFKSTYDSAMATINNLSNTSNEQSDNNAININNNQMAELYREYRAKLAKIDARMKDYERDTKQHLTKHFDELSVRMYTVSDDIIAINDHVADLTNQIELLSTKPTRRTPRKDTYNEELSSDSSHSTPPTRSRRHHRTRRNAPTRSRRHESDNEKVRERKNMSETTGTGTNTSPTYSTKDHARTTYWSNEKSNRTYDRNYEESTYDRYHNKSQPYRNPNHTVDTYFLRKNVKLSCTDDAQLLDFYIKLRLIIQQGGIHLIPIEDITPSSPLKVQDDQDNMSDYNTQSNALYTLLSNEDIISTDYVQAQNCIRSYSQYMDGFATLKSMLSTVHPNLTNNPPPTKPPQYSEHTDLHTYDQSLRHYYLQHYLYDGHNPNDLQKAKQFIRGLDTDMYRDAKTRVITQLDHHSSNNTPLPTQYSVNNLASTILNMTEYHPNVKTLQVNMAQKPTNSGYNQSRAGHTQYKPTNQPKFRRTPLQKTQCLACKTFGHKTQDCNIVGKILAVLDLHSKKPALCDRILQSHINKNSPSRRMAIIKTLQNMDILSADITPDEHLINTDVDEHITATVNATDCNITSDMMLDPITDNDDHN